MPKFFKHSLNFEKQNTNPLVGGFNAAGPKEWLKDQKKKSSRFLLAPIDASRESLRSVYLSLSTIYSLYLLPKSLFKFNLI